MTKKKILIVVLFTVIIGAFIAYKIYNKPHVNVSETKPYITLTADKIINDFSLDETAANTIYLDKIIEVKGTVLELKNENGKGIITLKTNDDFGNVIGHLSSKSTKKINTLKEGQAITLKGVCTGYLMDVILIKCVLIN